MSAVIRAAAVAAPERVGWLVAEAEAIARSIEDTRERADALRTVASAVAAADAGRGEAIARSIEDAYWRAHALADLARLLAQPG